MAVGDHLGALRRSDEGSQPVRVERQQLLQVGVPRTRNVPLPCVAGIASRAGVLAFAPDVQKHEAVLADPRGQLVPVDVTHARAATTSISAATDGARGEPLEPIGDRRKRVERDAHQRTLANQPRHVRDVGEPERRSGRGTAGRGAALSSRARAADSSASAPGSLGETHSAGARSRRGETRAGGPRHVRQDRPAGAEDPESAPSRYSSITADSGKHQSSSSSTGTLPAGFFVVEPAPACRRGRSRPSRSGTPFSASTMRTRAQYGQRGASYRVAWREASEGRVSRLRARTLRPSRELRPPGRAR